MEKVLGPSAKWIRGVGKGLWGFAAVRCGSHHCCYSGSRQGIASNMLLRSQRGFLPKRLLLGKVRRAVKCTPRWQWVWWLQKGRLHAQSKGAPAMISGWTPSGNSSLELNPQEWLDDVDSQVLHENRCTINTFTNEINLWMRLPRKWHPHSYLFFSSKCVKHSMVFLKTLGLCVMLN